MKTWIKRSLIVLTVAVWSGPAMAQTAMEMETLDGPGPAMEKSAPLTKEEIEKAIPMPSPEVTPEELKQMIERNLEKAPKQREEKQIVIPPSDASDAATTYGVPTKVSDPEDKRPFWNVGKLYFKDDAGTTYSCTAQFVASKRVLMTAAHCVYDATNKKWYKNFEFRRAYDNGGGQSVGVKCITMYKAYYDPSKNRAYDYAFAYTDTDSGAGYLGFKTGIPYSTLVAVGYPQNYGSAKYMYQVTGSKGAISGGIVTMNGNPMRHGNSGGAWIGDLSSSFDPSANMAVGLNSFHLSGNTTDENGPYFDTNTYNLLQRAKNQCN